MAKQSRKFTNELLRRRVLRTLAAYAVLVWLLAQGLVDLFPAVGLPEWAIQAFLAAAVVATPFVAILAWRYDLTSKGILRDRIDVENARRSEVRRPGEISSASTLHSDTTPGQVTASWKNESGQRCEREFHSAFLIGRDYNADVRLVDDRVSRRHLQVYPSGDQWFVKDLGSLNGTYVGGEPIDVEKLQEELEIALHKDGPKVQLRVRIADETAVTVGR